MLALEGVAADADDGPVLAAELVAAALELGRRMLTVLASGGRKPGTA